MPVAKGQKGVEQEMHKFKVSTLHSGSKKGPLVTGRKQAIAIALHEAGLSKYQQSTKGSPPFTDEEIHRGYRRL